MSALYLLGFRGAGKTTLGLALALNLGWDFFDSDQEWERRHQQTILEFVKRNGIAEFRRGEEEVLGESLRIANSGRSLVVATGGGCVDWPGSIELLSKAPWPRIFLDIAPEELWRRLSGDPQRLEIGHLATLPALQTLLEQRRFAYEKIATDKLRNRDISGALIELAGLAEKI